MKRNTPIHILDSSISILPHIPWTKATNYLVDLYRDRFTPVRPAQLWHYWLASVNVRPEPR